MRCKTHGNSQATVHEAELVPSVLGESHRPGGDLGGMEMGTLSGDYVA